MFPTASHMLFQIGSVSFNIHSFLHNKIFNTYKSYIIMEDDLFHEPTMVTVLPGPVDTADDVTAPSQVTTLDLPSCNRRFI